MCCSTRCVDESSRLRHYEILLRVQRPDGDVTSIAGFLDAAERYQLLERLDSWVLAHVLTMLAPSVQKLCAVGASFAVNITGQSLSQPAFADFVRTKIKLHDIPAGLLDFELTETAAVRNLNATRRFISRMAEIGAHVALDDFGTGLSSLMHLKDLDVHRIKIDGKFVRDVLSNARSRALIRALVQIANEIGLETVAEFVETEDVASSVRELGVQCAQGYFYGRPRPLTETLRDLVAIHQEDPSDLPEYRAVGLR
jgi:ammonium transporter, Amt family